MTAQKFVVAHLGARDGYQVCHALHERGLFEALATDWARRAGGRSLLARLAKRGALDEELELISSGWGYASVAAIRAFGPESAIRIAAITRTERAIARNAGRCASGRGSGVFAYAGCGYEAFQELEQSRPGARRILMLVHPHPETTRRILAEDLKLFPECRDSFAAEREVRDFEARRNRLNREFELADQVIVPSEFAKSSIPDVHKHCVSVVPYGLVEHQRDMQESRSAVRSEFLFVGQGVQKKGLHHLLRAWKIAGLRNARLRVVGGSVDPKIAALASGGVEFVPHVSRVDLQAIYGSSHALVLPSLIEGFGLVMAEALSRGLFVVGSVNSGFPDLQLAEWAGLAHDAGDIEGLTLKLVGIDSAVKDGAIDHGRIAATACKRTSADFRRDLVAAIEAHTVE